MSKRKAPLSQSEPASKPALLADLGVQWTNGIDFQADGLISWRNYVAIMLRDIAIEDALAGLVPVISEMERLTQQRILDFYTGNPEAFTRFGFYEWQPHWQDHFRHWQDPVRDMLGALCVTHDAQLFARQLHAVDGQVLLDFLLTPCSTACWLLPALSGERGLLYPDSPVSMIDNWQPGRMHEQLSQVLYGRFREIAPFATLAVPYEVNLGLNYDRLCPEELHPRTHNGFGEASPC